MSRYSATVTVDFAPPGREGDGNAAARAIYESIRTDESFYPDNPVRTAVEGGAVNIVITSESDNLAHLRANLNSTLRLIQASYAAITESASR